MHRMYIPFWDISDFRIIWRLEQIKQPVKSTYEPDYERFCALLREARVKAGQTQADVAMRLLKPQSFVSKVESGERRLDLVEYIRWAKAVGIDPTALISTLAERIALPRVPKPRKRVLLRPG